MFETFLNRDDAGNKLADRLSFYVNNNPLILMIPRGGVVVAYETIRRFGFD